MRTVVWCHLESVIEVSIGVFNPVCLSVEPFLDGNSFVSPYPASTVFWIINKFASDSKGSLFL